MRAATARTTISYGDGLRMTARSGCDLCRSAGRPRPVNTTSGTDPVAEGARNWSDKTVEEVAVENGAVRMLLDRREGSGGGLRGTKCNAVTTGDRLDKSGGDPVVVFGDENSLSSQHGCHLMHGGPTEPVRICAKPRPVVRAGRW
jgi:hypothetical protein